MLHCILGVRAILKLLQTGPLSSHISISVEHETKFSIQIQHKNLK
jgi:hypothetical protein